MNRRTARVLLFRHRRLLASLCAGLTVWSALQILRPPEPVSIVVAVASSDMPSGHVIEQADVTSTRMPLGSLPRVARLRSDELVGRVLVGPILRGEPITSSRVLGPSLLSKAGPGRVAITVRVRDAGTIGLLRTGDVVDVLTSGGEASVDFLDPPNAVTLARRARVLVVPMQPEGGLLASGADRRYDGTLVVLALSEADARRVAAHSGDSLSLILIE